MSTIWRKVLRDLWRNKFRTFLVVLSTAVGVFAIGFVYGASGVLSARLTESHESSRPAHLTFYTGLFDQEVVETIKREPGVADAEAATVASIRWKLEGEEDWRDGILIARADYDAQRMNLAKLEDGRWPGQVHTRRELVVERGSARHFGMRPGTTVLVEFERYERPLPIEGIARDSESIPPPLGNATFFATGETITWLTGWPEGFSRLYVRMDSFSEEGAEELGDRIQDRLERMGVAVGLYNITDPEVHGAQEIIDAVGLILTVLGGLSLVLSAFLIVNMMNATIVQQVWQIGVMKVIGATGGQIVRVYLSMALLYGLLALILAVPPGAMIAYLLAGLLLNIFNVAAAGFRLMPAAVGLQVAVGVCVPVAAALVPVIGGARITPHRAISSYGLGGRFGRSWLDRLIGRVRHLPRPLALSLRNTFRRKARITLTLLTLVLGGMMFIVVLSVGTSMNNTLEVLLNDLGFDALVILRRSYRVTRLMEAVEHVSGVDYAEVWDVRLATLELESGDEIQGQLWAVPDNSRMFQPRIVSGRNLLPDDGRAILLNSKIAADEGYQVGDEVTLTIDNREATWTVVGLILNVNNLQRDNFVPFDAVSRETGNINRGGMMMVKFEPGATVTQQQLIRDLRTACDGQGVEIAIVQGSEEVRQSNKMIFNAIIYLMLAMAVLAAVVGSIGLMSTMAVNVVERRREIGVMRAVGASSVTMISIFLVEGVLVGVLSWLLAVPLSYPAALLFNNMVSSTLFNISLDFQYSMGAVVAWLGLVVVLSGLASLWPSLQATQVSVREALSYE